MRYFALFLFLFALGYTLPAGAQKAPTHKVKIKKSSKKTVTTQAPVKANAEAGPVITFERTPCFGTCPGYKMQVYSDGRVEYEGRRAVPMMGKKELRLSANGVTDMLRQAQEAHFDQFQNRYSRNTSDLPSTIIGIRQPNGQLKTVVVEEGEPENVTTFVASFAKQFDALAQLAGPEK